MIVNITGLAKKVLFTGSPAKFVIAIAQIVQTSYRATTNISESSWKYFSTNDSGYLFHFFQEKNGEFHTCKEFVHS